MEQRRLSAADVATLQLGGGSAFRCAHGDCKSHEVVGVMCHFCKRNFCFPHRHPPDHACDKIPETTTKEYMPKTAALVKGILQGTINNLTSPNAKS